jgi:hypothetical protein
MKRASHTELMGEDIIALFLSTEPLRDANAISSDYEAQLRRFIHDQGNIEQPCVIGSGKHGVVLLASIQGKEYALKVVSISRMTLQLIFKRVFTLACLCFHTRAVWS